MAPISNYKGSRIKGTSPDGLTPRDRQNQTGTRSVDGLAGSEPTPRSCSHRPGPCSVDLVQLLAEVRDPDQRLLVHGEARSRRCAGRSCRVTRARWRPWRGCPSEVMMVLDVTEQVKRADNATGSTIRGPFTMLNAQLVTCSLLSQWWSVSLVRSLLSCSIVQHLAASKSLSPGHYSVIYTPPSPLIRGPAATQGPAARPPLSWPPRCPWRPQHDAHAQPCGGTRPRDASHARDGRGVPDACPRP